MKMSCFLHSSLLSIPFGQGHERECMADASYGTAHTSCGSDRSMNLFVLPRRASPALKWDVLLQADLHDGGERREANMYIESHLGGCSEAKAGKFVKDGYKKIAT